MCYVYTINMTDGQMDKQTTRELPNIYMGVNFATNPLSSQNLSRRPCDVFFFNMSTLLPNLFQNVNFATTPWSSKKQSRRPCDGIFFKCQFCLRESKPVKKAM